MSAIIEAQRKNFVVKDMNHAEKLVNSYLKTMKNRDIQMVTSQVSTKTEGLIALSA